MAMSRGFAPGAPWWMGPATAVIRRLPAGRSRAASALSRLSPPPFVARLPAALGGARFWCDLADEIARDAGVIGAYEPQISWIFARVLASGMTFVDAGANWGYFSLVAAARVGSAGRVVALEPDPRMVEQFEANVRLNAMPQIRLQAAAASAGAGTVALEGYAPGSTNRGTSRIRPSGSGAAGGVTVPTVAIDDLLDGLAIQRVDVIKIDVEGAEADVLAGMRAGLLAHRYQRIFIELHPDLLTERGTSADACCAVLRGAGYRGWTFDHSPAARRRAAYFAPRAVADVVQPGDRLLDGDPWPHMLWTAPGAEPS
jgi:FkbM family methyltransferase